MWNTAAESISFVIACIILVYSVQGLRTPSMKNKTFMISLIVTLCAIGTNLVTIAMISYFDFFPLWLHWIINTVYFLLTPTMGAAYCIYSLVVVYENRKIPKIWVAATLIPGVLYVLIIIANLWTHWIFNLDYETEYTRGPLIILTYLIFYVYSVYCFVLVMIKRKRLDVVIRRILMAFPLLAAVVVVVQQFIPSVVLSGSAAVCSLLIIYLYLQNKRISIDALTGLYNRQEFLKMLEYCTEQGPKNTRLSIIVVSMNDFKLINDKFGQNNGDLFLKDISRYIKKMVREIELFRYSGDEFAILLQNADATTVWSLADKVCRRFQSPWELENCKFMVSAAVALVEYPQVAADLDSILNGIECTVDTAKRLRLGTVCSCSKELLDEESRKGVIISILREALANDQFEVYYQPILDVRTGRFSLAEALLRLPNTSLGYIGPGEFIPIAEECGLIVDITYMVLEKVCGFLRRILDQGGDIKGISVNFSFIQFMQENLEERVLDILERYKISPNLLKIEVTEGVLISNPQKVQDFISRMKEIGVRFGLDDFGTGYSNLATVFQATFDTIKLDKSIVWSCIGNPDRTAFMTHLTRGLTELGVTVLAEGVETVEQSAFVRHCGCALIQGFLYSKPMPADGAMQMLLKSTPLKLIQ